MKGADRFDLQRFVDAQEPVYDTVLDELRNGAKRSHWIWFVFPQLQGLGRSPTAQHYGISSLDEARAYLAHEVLGPRLRECVRLVAAIEGRSAQQIFGSPDDLKVRSSMTLFARATEPDVAGRGGSEPAVAGRGGSEDNADFLAVLAKFYGGEQDPLTIELLAR